MIKFALAILLSASTALASCPKNVQVIKQGEQANCSGFLFSEESEERARKAIDDVQYYEKLVDRLEKRKDLTDKEISILDKRLQLYVEQSEVLSKQLSQKNNEDFWQKTVYFGLGVLATGLAVHGAAQLK